MKRADLAWALKAVLPHCGRTDQDEVVGLEQRGSTLYAYATDKYTIGIARCGIDQRLAPTFLSRQEATELERFVRPGKVGEREEPVEVVFSEGLLHVGIPGEALVFDTTAQTFTLDDLQHKIDRVWQAPPDEGGMPVQVRLMEKFDKARRDDFDRLVFWPARFTDKFGASVVTVGSDFIGCIAGMDARNEYEVATSLLQIEGAA